MPGRNRGFALIAAVILIVVASAMAAVMATMIAGSTVSGGMHIGSARAIHAAEAGLERGLYERNRNSWNCASPASYTATLGTGGATASYTATCAYYNPASTTLSAAINGTTTVIPVVSLAGYAPRGRVKIESEYIDYPATASSPASCGVGINFCLLNVHRGAENTTAAAHSSGASVSQDHYLVTSVGTSDPDTQRTLSAVLTVAGNLLPTTANANFNDPPGVCNPPGCSPTNWVLTSSGDSTGQRWDDTGGPDGSRSAIVVKASNGPTAGTTAGQFSFSPAITIVGPTTVTITFDYKHEIGEPAAGTMSVMFTMREASPGTNVWTSVEFTAGKANGYRSGSTTIEITQTGALSIDKLDMSLVAKAGQAKTIRLDNISLSAGGGSSTQVIRLWRENFP